MMADVLQMPIRISKSEQTCALGAAMFGATAAGIYPNIQAAMKAMGGGFDKTYTPDVGKASFYGRRFEKYETLGNFTAHG